MRWPITKLTAPEFSMGDGGGGGGEAVTVRGAEQKRQYSSGDTNF